MSTTMSPEAALLKQWFPWTSTPLIVGAPMRTVSGPKLTAAIHEAEGLGFLGIGYELSNLPSIIQATEDLLSRPMWMSASSPTRFGIGFLTWNCSISTAISQLCVNSIPGAIWLFGCRTTNELSTWAAALKEEFPQTPLFYQAGSIAEVDFAVQSLTPKCAKPLIDAIVVQGVADAGGHGLQKGASLMTLLPEAIDHIAKLKRTGDIPPDRVIPVLAAGGIMDARGAAAALALGAHGIVLGTRLIASQESEAHEHFKELLVKTTDGGQQTVRTRLYDEVRGTGGWPEIYGGRAIINKTFVEHENGVRQMVLKERYSKAVEEDDFARLTAFAGTGVGLIHDIRPAGEIVREVREGAKDLLKSLQW